MLSSFHWLASFAYLGGFMGSNPPFRMNAFLLLSTKKRKKCDHVQSRPSPKTGNPENIFIAMTYICALCNF